MENIHSADVPFDLSSCVHEHKIYLFILFGMFLPGVQWEPLKKTKPIHRRWKKQQKKPNSAAI
jgi:hypothetical protein